MYAGAEAKYGKNVRLAQIRLFCLIVSKLDVHIVLTFLYSFAYFAARRTLWRVCSDCDNTGSAEWRFPPAAEVYINLEESSAGSRDDTIELDGSSGERARRGLLRR